MLLHLYTPRLILRPFEDRDREPFAVMNADPEVMRYFHAVMTREESDEAVDRYIAGVVRNGFDFLAAVNRCTGEFAGTLGLRIMPSIVPGLPQPAHEIGWRLNRAHQGQGLATEGARALLDHAFHVLRAPEVVACTVPVNIPSRHVMEKLGMVRDPALDFDHPRVPIGHSFVRHVLYRLPNPLLESLYRLSSETMGT